MTLKTKISLGLFFLFAVIILIGGIGSYYSYKIASDSKEVLKSNHNSIRFARNMLQEIELILEQKKKNYNSFEENLSAQEKNITEPGEKMLTYEVRLAFEKFKRQQDIALQDKVIRENLYHLIDVNMKAILVKNEKQQVSSERVLSLTLIIATICFLIVFTFIINFPGYIANPIQKLTAGIKQISNRNYKERINIISNDEFGELANAFNLMAEKLDEYENSNLAQIISEKKRVEAIINQMNDGVIGIDTKKNLLFINPVAKHLLDITTNEFYQTLISSNQVNQELEILIKGEKFFYHKELFSVINEDKTIGQFIILKNVTFFKERDVAKTNFIATISHELKTPLASTDIGLRLLENDKNITLSTEQKEIISDLKKDNQRLIKIVNELLNLSQAETGVINFELAEVDTTELIEFAKNTFNQQAAEHKVSLVIEIEENLRMIKADREKAIWVLINLISNAIRYSLENSNILISAKNDISNKVLITVTDSGKGIPEAFHQKIFERFYKVPSETNRQGSGLGLAISKEFMLAMGGEISVKNATGKGAKFTLRFKAA